MWNAGLDEEMNHKLESRLLGETFNNLKYADDTTLMAESEELKSLLMRAKKRVKKLAWNNIKKTKIMASGPITSWQIDGGKMETMTDFLSLGSKITSDGDCSHGIDKTLAPWKESYDKPRQHIKKHRHHFADKSPYNQSYGFSSSHIQMWELEIRLSIMELMFSNCGAGGDSWEPLGLQGGQVSQS